MIKGQELKRLQTIQSDLALEIAHGICVSNLASRVGKEFGLPKGQCYELALAGLLHDVGKLELSQYIYARDEDTLDVEQMKYARTHSTISFAILNRQIYSKFIMESILYHHENFDGTGYPANMSGLDIPLGARILRVCDVFAALIADRPYRRSFDVDVAVDLMIEEVKNFDMKIFLTFLRVINEEGIEGILDVENLRVEIEEDLK